MRVRASIFFRSSFAAKRHGVLLGLSLLLLRPDAALSEIVFSGDRNIAIPTNFDGVYINIGNGQSGSSPVSGWDLNPFFGGLFIANSPNFQPARIGDDCEDAIIRLAPTSVIGGNLTYSSDWGGSGAEGGQGHLGSGPLQFADGKSGYFGFKLVSEEADPLYGWMQVVLTENGANGRIQSWAYETSGGSILVGVTGQNNQRVVSNVQAPVNASNAGDAILLGATGKITFEESGQQQGSFSGKIEGDGEIKVAGAGGLRLTGSNTFSGIASVLEGSKLTVTKNENIGSAEVKLGASAAWVFDSSAAYNGDVNTFANKITLDQGNATLSNIGDGVVEIAGAIDGEGSLVKDGTGDMKITGNNTYTGNTTINDGKLVVNGRISTSQLTTVNDGAALGGAGAVGALTVHDGGMLTPGNSPGNLTVNGDMSIAGEYIWELASLFTDGRGTNYDTVTVTEGNVLITGATLSLNLGANAPSQVAFWQTDQVWEGIINNTGSGTLTGNFEPIDNSEWLSLGYFWTDQSGNDVNLRWTVVPEPSAAILVGLGAIGLLGRRSRS
jgi:autotransporter-associated beta strand protein